MYSDGDTQEIPGGKCDISNEGKSDMNLNIGRHKKLHFVKLVQQYSCVELEKMANTV